jgi:CO/xanthine dehydrogenase FAD-binding subunit
MKPAAFDYYRPDSVAETTSLLSELRENATLLAGGMTLGPMLNLRMLRPQAVVDISRLDTIKSVTGNGNLVVTGSGMVQQDALMSPVLRREVPLLSLALPHVGHFQTRNRGTLGGSVAHADPSAEIPLCLAVTGGHVVLASRRRERRIPARDFFVGALTTERQPDEMIVALEWPRAPSDAGHAFEEIAQRHGDFAIAAAACQLRTDRGGRLSGLSLGLGGVESRPVALDVTAFIGRPVSEAIADLPEQAIATLDPIEDHSASAEFRIDLARALIRRVLQKAHADAGRREALQ